MPVNPYHLMFTDSYYMRNGINEKSGAHIVVEDNKKSPSMSRGIDAMPNTETNIGLKKHVLKRLEDPYQSNCTVEYQDEGVKNYSDQGFVYSSKICKGLCFANEMHKLCNCVHPSLFEGFGIKRWFSFDGLSQIRACNLTLGSEDIVCMTGIQWSTVGVPGTNWDQPCECNAECTEISYEVNYLLVYLHQRHLIIVM